MNKGTQIFLVFSFVGVLESIMMQMDWISPLTLLGLFFGYMWELGSPVVDCDEGGKDDKLD